LDPPSPGTSDILSSREEPWSVPTINGKLSLLLSGYSAPASIGSSRESWLLIMLDLCQVGGGKQNTI
jgi:hypothetical protein